MKSLFLPLLLSIFITNSCFSQVFHFIPPFTSDLDKEVEVFSIAPKNTGTIYAIASNSNEFIITFSDGTIEKFDLEDKTIEDLIQSIQAKYKDKVNLHSGYLSYSASILTEENFVISDTSFKSFKSKKAPPKYILDFGVIYSTATKREEYSNPSLFNETGFNFNFLGHYKYNQGRESKSYSSYRLGFSSNTNLDVSEKSDTTEDSEMGPKDTSFTSVLKRASQASMSTQFERILCPKKRNPFEITVFAEIGMSFNRLKTFDLANVQINLPDGVRIHIVDTFSSKAIEMFQEESTRPLFTGFAEAGLNFKYIKNDKLFFYGGIGGILVPNVARVIRYKFEDGVLDKDFLGYETSDLGYLFKIRPKIGFSLPNLIEIRAEAIYDLKNIFGKIDRNSRDNIYRIAITKDFPIK